MTFSFTLIDTAGVSHALDGSGGVLAGGRDWPIAVGMGMPSYSYPEDKLPYSPGTRLRRILTPGREISLPLVISSSVPATMDDLMDDLRGWLLPGTEYQAEPSTVTLRVTRDDAAVREIEAVYAGGLEGGQVGPGIVATVLSLYAPDPYWQDAADTELTFTSGSTVRTWFPYFPFSMASSQVFAEQIITNSGQVEAWPVWTLTGPSDPPVLRNLTTGASIELDVTLLAGDSVVIDTRPRVKTITSGLGVNLFPQLSLESELWPLVAGDNEVSVEMGGADANSSAVLSYRRRWAGAWR